jgi:tetratricopeptide (TPR) repeat protein
MRYFCAHERLAIALLIGLLSACADEPVDLPPLPVASTEGFLPAVRAQIDAARAAVEKSPLDARKNGDYAMILHSYDHSEHALIMYDRALRLAPRDPRWPYYRSAVLQRLGDLDASLAALDHALALSPAHIDVMTKRGEALFLLGRLDEAQAELARVVERNPNYPFAQFYLGRLRIERQEWEEAVEVFEDLLTRGLNLRDVHQNLGVAYRMLDRIDEARRHLDIAAHDHGLFIKSYDPINRVIAKLNMGDQPHLLAAREHYASGNLSAAERELRVAVGKNPDSLGANVHLIRIYAEQDNVEAARRHYRRVMDIEPSNAIAHANWGLALHRDGQLQEAADAFRHAIRTDPRNAEFHLALGHVLNQSGEHEAALAELDESLVLQPESRDAHYLRGSSLLALGRYADALQALQQARLPEDAKTSLVLSALARTYRALGRNDMAIQQFEVAISMAQKYDNVVLAGSLEGELKQLRESDSRD